MKLAIAFTTLLSVPLFMIGGELTVPRASFAAPDGCGSGSWGRFVPNNPTFGASFKPACDTHDTCYETLGNSKEDCDNQFYNNMVSICSTNYADSPKTFWVCKKVAGGYYKVVDRRGGEIYREAQEEARRSQGS
jgi:Group XII secretory phospholipase A2 precursor (PLA2G12)